MQGVVHRADQGEALFGGRIVLKAAFEQLCITETLFSRARPGADPHVHRRHADSFFVLEGELAFLVGTEEHRLGPGGCVCAPAGVVHGFRSTTRARFLNFHTPDAGFADNLRARDRGEPGGFDSFDAPADGGLPASGATLLGAGQGERLEANHRVATIKIEREELTLIELELEPGFEAPEPHGHDDHVDAFYVLEGEAGFLLGDEELLLGAGSFVAAPPGAVHTFSSGPGPTRLLNVHAPRSSAHRRRRPAAPPRPMSSDAGRRLSSDTGAGEEETMRTLIVTEFVTLDGRMEAPGGEPTHPHSGWTMEFGVPELYEFKLRETLEAESLLLGRVTYQGFSEAWPPREGEFADKMNAMPKHVASTTLRSPGWNATVLEGDVPAAVAELKQGHGGPILVAGSCTLVHTLLTHRLVDELRLMVYPVTIGSGLSVFPETAEKATYELADLERYSSGVLLQIYRPAV